MGVVFALFCGFILALVGLILLIHPKNYSKKGVLYELNKILERANKEFEDQERNRANGD